MRINSTGLPTQLTYNRNQPGELDFNTVIRDQQIAQQQQPEAGGDRRRGGGAVFVPPEGKTPERLVLDLLSRNQGIMLGEFHTDRADQEQFVADMMPALREAGVTDIFVELPQAAQEALDAGGEKLRDYISAFPENVQRPGYIPMVEAAHKARIRVVAMDLDAHYQDVEGTVAAGVEERLRASNPYWADVVYNHMEQRPPNAKYVVYGGAAHSGTNTYLSAKGITGVDNLLGIPSVDFYPPRGMARLNFMDPFSPLAGALPDIEPGQVIRGEDHPEGGPNMYGGRVDTGATGDYIVRID